MTQTPGTPPENSTSQKSAPNPPPVATPVPPQAPAGEVETNSDAKTMALLCYILCIFTTFLGPLIIWLVKKDQHKFVDDQGKETLNWGIMVAIAAVGTAILTVVFFFIAGPIFWLFRLIQWGVLIANAVLCIMGAMKVNQGLKYRFPFLIKIVK
jgi:uncharacterized Tic20 family protein